MENINQLLSVILFCMMIINALFKSNDRFLIILVNAVNGLGIIYYAFGGELYKKPSILAIHYMLYISIAINLVYFFYILFYKNMFITKTNINNLILKSNKKTMYLLALFFLLPLFYFILFFDSFPLYHMIVGNTISEGFRPDVSGALPHFYSFSVFLSSLSFPFLVQLYIVENNKILKLIITFFLLFFAFMIGDKSTLLVIIFYFFFVKGTVSLTKIISFTLFFISFYIFIKYLYYQELTYIDLYSLFESIFRRVCLIGPSLFGTYIDYFVLNDGSIPSGFSHIKQFVFYLVYGYKTGGAPVFFPASFLELIKLGVIQVLLVALIFLIILLLRNFIFKKHFYFFPEAVKYLHFYGAILLSESFLSDSLIRWLFPVVFFILLDKSLVLIKNKYEKKG